MLKNILATMTKSDDALISLASCVDILFLLKFHPQVYRQFSNLKPDLYLESLRSYAQNIQNSGMYL